MESKICSKCKQLKSLSNFWSCKTFSDGLHCSCKDCMRLWRKSKEEVIKDYQHNYNKNNRDTINIGKRKRRKETNGDIWSRNNRDKINSRRKELRELNPNYKLRDILRNRIRTALKESNVVKNLKSNELLGCSVDDARKHIESMWLEGMNWGNHGFGDDKWHIDHILPCASFDLTNLEEQKKCFHYTNLQPLWQHDNLVKKDKILPARSREDS